MAGGGGRAAGGAVGVANVNWSDRCDVGRVGNWRSGSDSS